MFNHSPSDRLQVRELGNLQPPSTCAVCGNGTCVEGYVDLDTWIDYLGQLYLCMNCALQAAEMIGCLVPDEAEVQKSLALEIAAENKTLKEQLANATRRLDVYDTAVLDAAISAGVAAQPITDPQQEQLLSSEPTDAAGSGESEPKESVEGGGESNDAPRSELGNGDTFRL